MHWKQTLTEVIHFVIVIIELLLSLLVGSRKKKLMEKHVIWNLIIKSQNKKPFLHYKKMNNQIALSRTYKYIFKHDI